MRAGSFALLAAIAATSTSPVAAQVADRTRPDRGRATAVGTATPRGYRVVGDDRDRRDDRNGPDGRARNDDRNRPNDRARDDDRNRRDDRDRWGDNRWQDDYCRDDRRGRNGRHLWFDEGGRFDCDSRYDRDRRHVGISVRVSLAREHEALLARLDREHDRWHRVHGWSARNRGWRHAHEALHRKLEREHEQWHRHRSVPFTLWSDGLRFDVVLPGKARGTVVIR